MIILQQLSHTAIGCSRKKVLKQHQTYPSEIPAFSRRKQGKIVLLLLFWPAEWNKEKHLPITFLAVMFSTSKMEWQQRRKNNRIQLLRHLRFPWLYSWQASVFSSDKHFNLDGELRDMAALQAFRDAPTWCLARTLHHWFPTSRDSPDPVCCWGRSCARWRRLCTYSSARWPPKGPKTARLCQAPCKAS